MSLGNKKLLVRVSPGMLLQIQAQIQQRNIYTTEPPWTVSDFIRAAIVEKLKHMERSRRSRGSRKPKA